MVVSGEDDGQAIVIRPASNEYLIIGFRCQVELWSDMFAWPALQRVHVERGRFDGLVWKALGEPSEYGVNPTQKTLDVGLDAAQVVRIHW